PIDKVEVQLTVLLARFLHCRHFSRNEVLDDPISVPDSLVDPIPCRDQAKLGRGGDERGFGVLQWILLHAVQDNEAHLLAKPVEAAEIIKNAVTPQEFIGISRQLTAIRTRLEPRIGAMVVEIALDQSVL